MILIPIALVLAILALLCLETYAPGIPRLLLVIAVVWWLYATISAGH